MALTFRVEGVTYGYAGTAEPVLRGLDLTMPRSSITAVLGRSGVGKSTLLYLLGLLWEGPLNEGRIVYHDGQEERDYGALSNPQRAGLRRRNFGFALQSSYLLPSLSCGENVAMPLALNGMGRRDREKIARRLLEEADPAPSPICTPAPHGVASAPVGASPLEPLSSRLIDRFDNLARNLAGGERRRMALVRSIIHNPHVLFADEPFSNLNERNCRLIEDLLLRWHRGELHQEAGFPRTLVLVTHDVHRAWKIADYFVVFRPDATIVHGRTLARNEVPCGANDLNQWIDSDSPA